MDILLKFFVAVAMWIPISIIVAFALGNVFSCLNKRSIASAPSHSLSLPFNVLFGNKTYRGNVANRVGVAVLEIDDAPFVKSADAVEKPEGTFMIATVAISNRQMSEVEMSHSLFELVDGAGNVYPASLKWSPGRVVIHPGRTRIDTLLFDIPPAIAKQTLKLRFRGGMKGDTSELPLMVQSEWPAPRYEEIFEAGRNWRTEAWTKASATRMLQ